MKTLNFDRNSWHGQLAYYYGPLKNWQDELDICSYTRAALRGLLNILVVGLVIFAFLAWYTIDFLAWVVSGMANGWVDPEIGAQIFMVIAVFGVLMVVCISLTEWVQAKLRARRAAKQQRRDQLEAAGVKPDGFLHNAYASFKDKFCVPVKVTNAETQDE